MITAYIMPEVSFGLCLGNRVYLRTSNYFLFFIGDVEAGADIHKKDRKKDITIYTQFVNSCRKIPYSERTQGMFKFILAVDCVHEYRKCGKSVYTNKKM